MRLGAKIMENFHLLPVVVMQLNVKEPHITFARKFDLIFAHAQTLFSPVGGRHVLKIVDRCENTGDHSTQTSGSSQPPIWRMEKRFAPQKEN